MAIEIYVANLGKYNEGILKGEWIKLPATEEEINEFLTCEVGINEQYEEYAIHDYMAPFKIGEYENIFELNEKAEQFQNVAVYTDEDVKEIIINEFGWDEGMQILEDQTFTEYDNCYSMEDVANEFIFNVGFDSIQNKEYYFDYEMFKRDLEIEGFFSELEREYEEENGLEEDSYEMEEDYKDYIVDEMVECGISEETMERYFDYEKFGRDLNIEGRFLQTACGYIEIH